MLMGVSPDIIEANEEEYIKILKLCKRLRPNLHLTDKLGRTNLHHAAAIGNSVGLQFTVQLLHYWFEKDHNMKVPDDSIIKSVSVLMKMRSRGGVTALMKAAEAGSCASVYYLLECGCNPLAEDN